MKEFEFSESDSTGIKLLVYLPVMLITEFFLFQILGDMKQTIAGTIFIALVIATLIFWRFRVAIAFIGIVILLVTRTIDLNLTVEYMSLDVILFLIGIMIIVGMLRRSGFFKWFLAKGLEFSRFKPDSLMSIRSAKTSKYL